MKRLLAAAALSGFLGSTALATRRYLATRDAIAAVPPNLRSPLLHLVAADVSARSLRFGRLGSGIATKAGPGVIQTEQTVPAPSPVQVLIMTPEPPAVRRPAVLYLHGGGMIMGSAQTEAIGSGRLARDVDAVVVSPDYRLAPEHPFPAAFDDCMATLRWMRDNADQLGIDPERIAVAGSSAGGGLSAAVAQRAFDEGITLRAQMLVYPMIDDRTTLRDDHHGRGRFVWTEKSNRFGWKSYLGREPRLSDAPEYAAPARREDTTGLAPAWIGVGSLDILHDEAVAYAEKLRADGVECELVTVPGMYHGADGLAMKDPAMLAFRKSSIDHLRAHL